MIINITNKDIWINKKINFVNTINNIVYLNSLEILTHINPLHKNIIISVTPDGEIIFEYDLIKIKFLNSYNIIYNELEYSDIIQVKEKIDNENK